MALRIVDNQMSMTRPLDMAGDRARDIRQSGLQTGTIQDINRDTEDTMHTVRDRPEVEESLVRTDSESESGGGGYQPQERKQEAQTESDENKMASERLLSLPVTSRRTEPENRGFDVRV
ncbi:MAG: hypothetical protein LBR76_07340 [Oscillospiraceae bacterium]|jgi:hypothetical protein|nr:hypothetical protein [Oscillospiraceae bacterium]